MEWFGSCHSICRPAGEGDEDLDDGSSEDVESVSDSGSNDVENRRYRLVVKSFMKRILARDRESICLNI